MDTHEITKYLDIAQRRKYWIIIPFLPVALALAQALLPLFNSALDSSLTMGFAVNGRLFAGAALLSWP